MRREEASTPNIKNNNAHQDSVISEVELEFLTDN